MVPSATSSGDSAGSRPREEGEERREERVGLEVAARGVWRVEGLGVSMTSMSESSSEERTRV